MCFRLHPECARQAALIAFPTCPSIAMALQYTLLGILWVALEVFNRPKFQWMHAFVVWMHSVPMALGKAAIMVTDKDDAIFVPVKKTQRMAAIRDALGSTAA